MPRKSSGRNGSYRRSCRESSTARLWTREGEFLELPSIVTAAVYELFRRLLVLRLHQEERPTERFMETSCHGCIPDHPNNSALFDEPDG